MNLVLYIHGKGGSAAESEHYTNLFPEYELLGLDYKTFTPWETGKEIRDMMSWAKFSEVFIFICTYTIIKNHRLS